MFCNKMEILLSCCDKLYHPSGKDPRFGPENWGSISAVSTECAIAHITTERSGRTVYIAEEPKNLSKLLHYCRGFYDALAGYCVIVRFNSRKPIFRVFGNQRATIQCHRMACLYHDNEREKWFPIHHGRCWTTWRWWCRSFKLISSYNQTPMFGSLPGQPCCSPLTKRKSPLRIDNPKASNLSSSWLTATSMVSSTRANLNSSWCQCTYYFACDSVLTQVLNSQFPSLSVE